MAGRGPARKPDSERVRRNVDDVPTTTVEADGKLHGSPLPEGVLEDGWPRATRDWWETWRRSPQAQAFTETDWAFLLDTALLHAQFWRGSNALAPELRLRVAKFGATVEDRLRLRLSISQPPAAGAAKPSGGDEVGARRDRRKRLEAAAGE